MNTPAEYLDTPPLNFNIINSPNVNTIIIMACKAISVKTIGIGRINTENPNTARIFIIFEPRMLPITKLVCLCLTADNDAANSGNEVPNATIDIPITKEDTPSKIAIPFAPITNKLAPNPSPTEPTIILTKMLRSDKSRT